MPKTEVILIQNIVGLGAESDMVKVAAGYARNYLFPQGLAVPVTGANKRRIEALKQRRAEREAHEFNTMSELAKSISKLLAVIAVKAGDDGKMYGAVTSGMIADQLKTQFDIILEKKKIHLEHPIKILGEHDIELRLHKEVTATLKLRIESSTPAPVPLPAAPEQRERRPGGHPGDIYAPRTESRGHKRAEREHTGDTTEKEKPAPEAPEACGEKEKRPRPGKPEHAGKAEHEGKAERGGKPEKSGKPGKREKAEA